MRAIVAVVLLLVAAAASAFAWERHQALAQKAAELARSTAEAEKARASLRSLQGEMDALRKEATEQKVAMEQLQADLNAARLQVDAEKEVGVRLREENAKLKEAVAVLARMRPRSEGPAYAPPTAVTPKPLIVAPAGRGAAVGAPQRAQ